MKNKTQTLILLSFLLGIFMGAIDTGIVSPAREIIQNGFKIAPNVGMWMITIYTLTFAVAMPIVSKLADRYGRKRIYTYGIITFAFGSLLCGVSNLVGGFQLMLVARVIQAIGGGGIMPISTAVIGQSFPEEKRGMALGLVGAIYGVATIIGPTLGSTILDIAGTANWGWLFLINLPISILIVILGTRVPNTIGDTTKPMDIWGSVAVAASVGSLMYALTNLDLFHFTTSIKQTNVYPFLLAFLVLLPVLIFLERRAKDPILNLKYFKNRQMLTVLVLAFIVGAGMMGMVFVPQFAENVLKIKPGSGGYIVTLLAVFSGFAAPISGRLIDKKSARFVMLLGFVFTATGTLAMGFFATKYLSFLGILPGLILMGFGVGCTMGAPLNYLALQSVEEKEGATALATMSLIRALGVAISPSLMIGFIVQSAGHLQTNLMETLKQGFGGMMASGMNMMGSNSNAASAFASLKTASIVDIVDRLKDIFNQIVPSPYNSMAVQGVEGLRSQIEQTFQSTLNTGYTHMFTAAATIALIGFIGACFLKAKSADKRKDNTVVDAEETDGVLAAGK